MNVRVKRAKRFSSRAVSLLIGSDWKAGISQRDWNRKREKKKAKGIPVAWHTEPKEVWSVTCLWCKAVRNPSSPRT